MELKKIENFVPACYVEANNLLGERISSGFGEGKDYVAWGILKKFQIKGVEYLSVSAGQVCTLYYEPLKSFSGDIYSKYENHYTFPRPKQ